MSDNPQLNQRVFLYCDVNPICALFKKSDDLGKLLTYLNYLSVVTSSSLKKKRCLEFTLLGGNSASGF